MKCFYEFRPKVNQAIIILKNFFPENMNMNGNEEKKSEKYMCLNVVYSHVHILDGHSEVLCCRWGRRKVS